METPGSDPLFSVITAVYGVERFLPAFIAGDRAAGLRPRPGRGDRGRRRLHRRLARPAGGVGAATSGPGPGRLPGQRRSGRRPQPRHRARPGRLGDLPRPRRRAGPQLLLRGGRVPRRAPRRRHGGRQPLALVRRGRPPGQQPPARDLLPLRPARRPRGLRRAVPRQCAGGVLPARPDPRARHPLRRPHPAQLRGRPLLLALPAAAASGPRSVSCSRPATTTASAATRPPRSARA